MQDKIPDPVPIEIVPHPLAPLFGTDPVQDSLYLSKAIDAMHQGSLSEEAADLVRQAGYVSLWFFTKYIAGFNGPFDKLTPHLHVDMANYRQRLLAPGSRGAMFIPRSHFKCLCADEKIFTINRGEVTVGDLTTQDVLPGLLGPTKIVGALRTTEPSVKVVLRNGCSFKVAKDHYVLSHRGWEPIQETPTVQQGGYWFPREKSDEDYFVGLLYGDGQLNEKGIRFTSADQEIVDFIYHFWGDVAYKGRYDYYLKKAHLWWKEKGLPFCLSKDKLFPFQYEGSIDFLRGLYDSDGSVGKQAKVITFASASESLAYGVMRNLALYGIHSSIHIRPGRSAFYVNIHGVQNMRRFGEIIGFRLGRKQRILESITVVKNRKTINWIENACKVRSVEDIGEREVVHLQTDTGSYLGRDGFVHHNTAVCTEGASAWEILRWPDIKIRITNAISDIAHDFMHSVKAIFDDNELLAFLYPHLYVFNPASQPRWSEAEMVSPGRTKKAREATIEAGGVGGGIEGHHYDLHIVDDMIGQKSLNSAQISAAEMERARNWFWNNEKSLLQSVRDSRVIVIGTRYAIDDVYDDILAKAKTVYGHPLEGLEPDPIKGIWDIYYRMAVEDNQVIFPENWTAEAYEEMKSNPDTYWTWVNQFMNNPRAAGVTEFASHPLKKCVQVYENGEWYVVFYRGGEEVKEPLSSMDVVQSIDPAASERRQTARTSRTAQGVMARNSEGLTFILTCHADYVAITEAFNWMFMDKERYPVRVTALEAQGPFKVLGPILREEQLRRGRYLNVLAVSAPGDKVARIRTAIGPEIEGGRLYVDEGVFNLVKAEMDAFPQSVRMDILDMVSLGLKTLNTPISEEDYMRKIRADKRWARRAQVNAAGY